MAAPAMLLLSLPLAADAAEEGKRVITWMLIVGLVFIAVIALGETSRWLRHRRRPYGH
jgi:NADH:ubiquinone oxidoreductase subunit 4 (subunit M)